MAGRRSSLPCEAATSSHYRDRSRYSFGHDLGTRDDNETRSDFAKKLEKELNRLKGIDWSIHTTDYNKLRKQLQRIVYAEDKSGDDISTIRRNHDIFCSMLQAEVSKVVICVRTQHDICELLLNKCALDEQNSHFTNDPSLARTAKLPNDSDSGSSSPASSPVFTAMSTSLSTTHPAYSLKMAIAFARVVYEQQPEMAKRLFPPSLLANLPAHPLATSLSEPHEVPGDVDAYSYTLCRKFLGVARGVDELRRFLLLNSIVVWKLIRKYQYNCKHGTEEHQSIVNKFQDILPVYESVAVDCLTHRVANVMNKLIGSVEAEESRERRSTLNLSCALCAKALDSSSVPLSCGHRLDFPCLLRSANVKGISCPACQNQHEIDKICIDTLLSQLNELSLSHDTYRVPASSANQLVNSKGIPASISNNAIIVKGCEILPKSIKMETPVLAFASPLLPSVSYASRNSKKSSPELQCRTVCSSPPMAATVCLTANPISEISNTFVFRSNCKNRNINGASCHQCKTNKDPSQLLFCTNRAEKNLRKRRCRKKFCDACLKRSYPLHIFEHDGTTWECPSCLQMCICAACSRRQLPPRNSADSSPTLPSESIKNENPNDSTDARNNEKPIGNHRSLTSKLDSTSTISVKSEPVDFAPSSKFELFSGQLSTSFYPSNQMNDSPISPLSLASSPTETPNLKARTVNLALMPDQNGNRPPSLYMGAYSEPNSYRVLSHHRPSNQLSVNDTSISSRIPFHMNGKNDPTDLLLPLSPISNNHNHNSTIKNQPLFRAKVETHNSSSTLDLTLPSSSLHSQLSSTNHTPKNSQTLTIDSALYGNASYQVSPRAVHNNPSFDSNLLSIDHPTSSNHSLLVPHPGELMITSPSHSRIPSFGNFIGFPADNMFMSDGDPFSILSPQHRRINTNDLLHTPTSSNAHKRIWSLDMGDPFTNN